MQMPREEPKYNKVRLVLSSVAIDSDAFAQFQTAPDRLLRQNDVPEDEIADVLAAIQSPDNPGF
jgi:hypothetical protein